MSYVEKSLAADETLVRKANFHWAYHVFAWASLILLGVILVGVIIFAWVMIWMTVTEIAVTDQRVLIKRGWLTRHTEELALQTIEEVNIDQGFWGRMLGFGKVTFGGSGSGEVKTPTIADPVGFRKAASDARSMSRRAATA